MIYPDIVTSVSTELNISKEVVDSAYKSFWDFIKSTIKELPLKEDFSEEEFSKLKTNFNIPSLGKLVCTYDKVSSVKRRFKYIKKLKENDLY
jgi:hypothetical protein